MGKLTDQQRAEIYQKWKDGQTPKELAKQYGVSDQAIYNLVNKMNTQQAPVELEDVENGIPNTPLTSEKIDKESANAEKSSENAEEWRLPIVVQDAVNRYIRDVSDEIEMRERRISDLNEELTTYRALYDELIAFRKAYREKVDAHDRAEA